MLKGGEIGAFGGGEIGAFGGGSLEQPRQWLCALPAAWPPHRRESAHAARATRCSSHPVL